MNLDALIQQTLELREKAYAPYSRFRVGALLLTIDGKTYAGCNIENSSYSLTICAERVALFHAIMEGERDFKLMLIASDSEKYCPPCGACRQVLWELAGDIDIVMINNRGQYKKRSLKKLLPEAFDMKFLEGK